MASNEFLIETILPANEIHLLAGPTGAGKTRWLMQAIKNQWENGNPVLGFESHPVPWVYIAADRSMRSVHRTLKGIGLDPETINIIPAWGKDKLTLPQILDRIVEQKAQLAIIEAFQSFSDSVDKQSVKSFLSAVQNAVDSENLTIIGVCESPKMKPYEKYDNPRQRVSGVASWGHFSDTIFLIEPSDATTPSNPTRKLFVCPRNGASLELNGKFTKDGILDFIR